MYMLKIHKFLRTNLLLHMDLMSYLGLQPMIDCFFFFRFKYHCLQTILHIGRLVLGYVVMLAVMSYNVWIGISVVIGM